jgi:O-antigen/teichoic acid export membrane protein
VTTASGLLRSGSAATAAQLLRIVGLQLTHIVARRFVGPAEWGPWNWLEPLFLLLATARDLGVPTHVMRLRPMPFGNFLRIEVVWGFALSAGVFLAAPWIAHAFADPGPQVVAGIRALAVALLVDAFGAVALIWFEGNLRLERTLLAEGLRTAVYCSLVLVLASQGRGFWSFVIAQIAAQSVFTLELWRRARREIVLHREPGADLRIVRESLPLAGIVLLTTAVTWADSFIVGRLFDPALLGLYAFGYAYAFLVFRILKEPIGRSLYPALVEFRDLPTEQFRAYRLATVFFLALEVPAALLLAANAELVTLVLAGESYLGAAPYLALLAFAPLVDPLGRFGGELLIARRLDRARVASLGLQLAALVGGGIALSLWLGTPFGMAWANFLPLGAPVVLWALARSAGRGQLARLGRNLLEVYLVPLVPFALAWWLSGDDRWVRLAATLAAAAVGLGWTWKRHGREFRDFFAGRAEGAPPPPAHLETQ